MGKIKIKVDNLTYSLSTDGWIYIYDGDNEIGHVETYSENGSLYSYEGEKFFEWTHALCLNGSTFYMNPNEQMIVRITSDVNDGYNGHLYGWNGDTIMKFWDGDVRNSYDNEVIRGVKKVINFYYKKRKELLDKRRKEEKK